MKTGPDEESRYERELRERRGKAEDRRDRKGGVTGRDIADRVAGAAAGWGLAGLFAVALGLGGPAVMLMALFGAALGAAVVHLSSRDAA